tara:strand:+ start:1932 stop:3908 length:1977 start_codon:yes stop_codon:yes gene_type:complete
MSWGLLLKSAGSKVAQQSGKKIAEKITKKVTEKKSKVKGKDVAKKMLGGGGESSGGGALVVRPSSSIVSNPAGGLVPTKVDEGGSLVVKSKEADELGLTSFMESITGVKESLNSIKESLNNNSEDVEKRLEKQRLLNAQLEKEEQEEALENKKPGLGAKLLKPAKGIVDSFLDKLKRFFKATLLGVLVNGLIGGQRDIVVTFLAGYKAYRMAKEAAVKFVFKLGGSIKNGLKGAAGQLGKTGKSIFQTLVNVGNKLKAWVGKAIKVVIKGATETVKRIPKAIESLNKLRKTPIRETIGNITSSIQSSGIGKRIGGTINKVKNLKLPKPGNIWKGIQQLGTRGVKFVSGKWSQISQWASNLQKNMMSNLDDMVKGGMETANSWGKKWNKFKDLATNPKKLFEVVKKALDSKVSKVLDKNPLIKKVKDIGKMKPKEIGKAVGNFIKNLGKNKNFLKVKDGLVKAKKLKIQGLDAVLAALLGIFDYVAMGESPINAVLRASGSLIGYTMGAAAGLAIPVPGASFVTGMAGAWAGEKFADGIAALLADTTPLGTTPDPLMKDGRMWVRNPFSGKGEGERMDNIQDAKLGDNKKEDVSRDISSSASYEEGGEEPIVIDGGGGQQSAPTVSQAGKVEFLPLGTSKETIVNTNHEANTNAVLYKV